MYARVVIDIYDAVERAILARAMMEIEGHRGELPESGVTPDVLAPSQALQCAEGEILACIVKQPEVAAEAPASAPMTDTDFLDRFATLARQHGIPETIKLLNERYGVNRASEVPSDKRQDLLDTLTSMLGGGAA